MSRLQKRLDRAREEGDGAAGAAAKVPDFDRLNLSASRERTLSAGNDAEDPLLVGKNDILLWHLLKNVRNYYDCMTVFLFRISDDVPRG